MNGWQRLWFLISIILIFPFSYHYYHNTINLEEVKHDDTFYDVFNESDKDMLILDREYIESILNPPPPAPAPEAAPAPMSPSLPQTVSNNNIEKDTRVIVKVPNGHVLVFKEDYGLDAMRLVGKKYIDRLKHEAVIYNTALLVKYLFFWVLCCIALYSLGYGIAWVNRGFEKKPRSAK
ncbi:MAG: hypothetical protein NZM04_08640 [Methylacidiphilales bacterium]|nr:hypothetical protein [Candidatus Methylacidiphilales bacterium]